MENDQIYQTVLDGILSLGISQWEKIVFYSEYKQNSFEMKFYVKNSDGYRDCFSLGISDNIIMDMFIKLDKEICNYRKNISINKQDLWTVMTITFESDLQFKADFDYSIIEDIISYKSEWKSKYLKD